MYHGIIFNQGNALAMCSGKWVYIGHYSCYTAKVTFYVLNKNFSYNQLVSFFRKIFITFTMGLTLFFFFFFRKILISFTCFFLKLFFVFLVTVIHQFHLMKKNYQLFYVSYVSYISIFYSHSIFNFLHRISFIRTFFIKTFLIRISFIIIFFIRIFFIRIFSI